MPLKKTDTALYESGKAAIAGLALPGTHADIGRVWRHETGPCPASPPGGSRFVLALHDDPVSRWRGPVTA